ncbi:MAG: hypothetical protein AB7L90_23260 [Hyphomicrobiaceae bacterium]
MTTSSAEASASIRPSRRDPWSTPDLAEIARIGEGFLACTFPGADYHHREHLISTVYVLRTYPSVDWFTELPNRIRRFNEANGGKNTDTAGYHHTITMFYIELIERFLAPRRHLDLPQACKELLSSRLASSNLMFAYYSRERLFSRDARSGWIAPDLRPVDMAVLVNSAEREQLQNAR